MGKVLIIDDDKEILTVVDLILSQHGFIVQSTFKWQETIDKIESFHPDLILMDVSLGRQTDGRDICEYIKTDTEARNIPIILFSAISDISQTYPACQAVDFIAKPFDAEAMISKIQSYLPVE
jgi:CheY-like chemotaxis protein